MPSFQLGGLPANPTAAIAAALQAALGLRRTPLVIRRAGSPTGTLITEIPDGIGGAPAVRDAAQQAAVMIFGVTVSLAPTTAAGGGAAVGLAGAGAAGLSPQHAEVEAHYSRVARSTSMYDDASKAKWGYSPEWLSSVGAGDEAAARELLAIACGGGCPLAIGQAGFVRSVRRVVDLGCGGGHDVVLAAKLVAGKAGAAVVGVDMSEPMLARTRAAAAKAGLAEVVSTVNAQVDAPPTEAAAGGGSNSLAALEESADLVISNGVFNLFVDKPAGFRTAFALCKPGGRFHLTDVVRGDADDGGTQSGGSGAHADTAACGG
eukprot:SAG22_NODE_1851_length_3443_cov_4.745215_3_plen_319_part_00